MKRYLYFIFILIFSTCFTKATQTISCTGHDACRNNIWNGEYNIYCGASNSERTCRSTTLNCGKNNDCSIKTQGSGHDAYQYSTVNAKESNSFKLTCQASGQRDCKSITIWCPQIQGSTCECISCPNTVTMKCVQGVSCNAVNNANIEYVEPDKYQVPDSIWKKDTSNPGKRPNCDKIFINSNGNYLWGTLNSCKKKCLEESTGLCNIISRYGENLKTAEDLYHCYFYKCMNPYNFTWIVQNQWGNGASYSNTYILPIRHYILDTRYINVYQNITKFVNKTRWINKTNWINQEKIIWINKTRWINKTNLLNKTIWINQNKTNWINKTKWTNKTIYLNKTRWVNQTNWINQINWINKTRWVNQINWINKTRWINQTKEIIIWINQTNWINQFNWLNKTRWINRTKEVINWINQSKEVINWINQSKEVINWINQTRINDVNDKSLNLDYNYQKNSLLKNDTNSKKSDKMNEIYTYGLYVSLSFNLLFLIFIVCRCSFKDFFIDLIDHYLCCDFCGLSDCLEWFTTPEENHNEENHNNLNESKEIELSDSIILDNNNTITKRRVVEI